MGKLIQSFYRGVATSSLPPRAAFSLIRQVALLCVAVKDPRGFLREKEKRDLPLIPSNAGYGHEYWIRRYSGYSGRVYGAIEHGVYFGDNTSTSMNPIPGEWRFGSFITYGDYRMQLLSKAYPEHLIVKIGPYIQYSSSDRGYKESIRGMFLRREGRTLAAFPAHSVRNGKRKFSHEEFAEAVDGYAAKMDCLNKVACISPMDFREEILSPYRERGFVVATSGEDPRSFLPRQRAVMELSDITVSNDLGTHVGYSVCLGVPHVILNPVKENDIEGLDVGTNKEVLIRQKRLFHRVFSGKSAMGVITGEQRSLVDYFWGDECLAPESMRDALDQIEEHSRRFLQ